MTQTAANLIVEPLQARTHEELHTLDKLNELVKKHNLLVRHIFNTKDDPVRWVDNTFDVPDESFVGQDYHCDRYRSVGNIKGHIAEHMTQESARGLRNIFKIWKITCNCALPYSDTNALIPVCSDCKRPLPNQED